MKIKIGNKTFEVSKEALESNPEELTLEFSGTLRTEEEDSTFIENHKKLARKEGVEIAVKKYREDYGFDGRSIEKLIEAVQKKTLDEAKIEPTEKIKKMQATLQDKEKALQNALSNNETIQNNFNKYKKGNTIDNELFSLIPDNTVLPKQDIMLILKNKLKFDVDENGNLVGLDNQGNVITNKTTANPEASKTLVQDFFRDNASYLKGVAGGSGSGDDGAGGSKMSVDDFIKEQREKGNAPNSEAFNTALADAHKNGLVDVD